MGATALPPSDAPADIPSIGARADSPSLPLWRRAASRAWHVHVHVACLAALIAAACVLGPGASASASGADSPRLPVNPGWTLDPSGLHPDLARSAQLAADEHVFVLDALSSRVVVFERTGAVRTTWGRFGYRPGEFYNPLRIAAGPDGSVYVTDRRPGVPDHVIWRFDGDGTLLGSWVSDSPVSGVTGDGQPFRVEGPQFADRDRRDRVRRWTPRGETLPVWPTPFENNYRYAASPHGFLFVSAGGDVRLHDSAGELLRSWTLEPLSGHLHSVAIAGNEVWIVERDPEVVFHRYTLSGQRTGIFRGAVDSPPLRVDGLDDGTLLVVPNAALPARVFSADMIPLAILGADAPVSVDQPRSVAMAPNGMVAIHHPSANSVSIRGYHGQLLTEVDLGPLGSAAQFDIEPDGAGHLWLAGFGPRLDAGGEIVGFGTTVTQVNLATGEASSPFPGTLFSAGVERLHLDTDAGGRLLVGRGLFREVVLFRPGNPLTRISVPGTVTTPGHGVTRYGIQASLAADGTIWALDRCCTSFGIEDGGSDRPGASAPTAHDMPPPRLRRLGPDGSVLVEVDLGHYGVDVQTLTTISTLAADRSHKSPSAIVTISRQDGPVRLLAFDATGALVGDARLPGTFMVTDADSAAGRLVVRNTDLALAPVRVLTFETRPAAEWRALYTGDPFFSVPAQLTSHLAAGHSLILDWGTGPPRSGMFGDDWAARFTKVLVGPPGMRHLRVRAFGGMRMWLNDQLVVDDWMAEYVEVDRPVFFPGTPVRAEIQFQDRRGRASLEMSLLPTARPTIRVYLPTAAR